MPGETFRVLSGRHRFGSFNPPPAVRPGETISPYLPGSPIIQFQSAPGGEAGGNDSSAGTRRSPFSFNPPPAVRPGETLSFLNPVAHQPLFQSAPGGEAGGNWLRSTSDVDYI